MTLKLSLPWAQEQMISLTISIPTCWYPWHVSTASLASSLPSPGKVLQEEIGKNIRSEAWLQTSQANTTLKTTDEQQARLLKPFPQLQTPVVSSWWCTARGEPSKDRRGLWVGSPSGQGQWQQPPTAAGRGWFSLQPAAVRLGPSIPAEMRAYIKLNAHTYKEKFK